MILPTSIAKYPGHIWKTDTGYRIGLVNTDTKRETHRFATREEAFAYIRLRSECEAYARVKNIIYRENDYLRMSLPGNGASMLFDECDLPLVQSHVWHSNNKDYVQCSKSENLPSTLFHVCIMGGNAPDGYEYVHLNGDRRDNRHCNITVAKKTRKRKL